MKEFPNDIIEWITSHFPDSERVYKSLDSVTAQERNRIIRCILVLSDSDYDSVVAWTRKSIEDYRDIIFFAEYDNRNVRKFNFDKPLNEQKEYSYEE